MMNLKNIIRSIKCLSICICLSVSAKDLETISNISAQNDSTVPNMSVRPVVDPSEAQDVDFSFYNDPYIMEQNQDHDMVDLIQSGIVDLSSNQEAAAIPIVDRHESQDVDFSFFNDPYAFEKFNNLPIKAKFGGYLQYSSWWDNRQNVTGGEGYILLFPQPKLYDVDCRDINARGEYNAGFLETRVRGEFFGPRILGAESYAYIESDFFGSNLVANRLRIRHAFSKLTWGPSEVLIGQFWNPTFEVRCYPLTLDFAVGIPNTTFARNPQVRYCYNKNKKEFIIAAAAQIDSTNNGPIGSSSTYLRHSRIPMLYARGGYSSDRIYTGFCVGFERIVPRLQSNKGYKVNESLNSAVALVFAKIIFGAFEIRQSLIYSQNANNISLLGGFAVRTVNPVTDERTYANLNNIAYWIDLNITKKIEPGIFIGIAKNLGAFKDVITCIKDPATGVEESTVYGQGVTISTLFKAAPRIRFHVLPVDFCTELEFARAAYGCLNHKAQIKNRDPVTSIRLLLSTFYYF